MIDGPDLVGHKRCIDCGAWVANEVTYVTAGRCTDCFRDTVSGIVEPVIVVHRRQRITVPREDLTASRKAKRRRANAHKREKTKKGGRRYDVHRRKMAARSRAWLRLQKLYPEAYDVLYAEEREKSGLDPWPIRRVIRAAPGEQVLQTLPSTPTYHAVADPGATHELEAVEPSNEDAAQQR